jgi:hypothetical protein
MAYVLLFLALLPTAVLVVAMVIRAWQPRSAFDAPKERRTRRG